jgi:drug/metabolite transporter (DMT)-like permease
LSKKKRHRWEIGLGLTVISSLAFGIAITSEKYLLDQIGMPTYSAFGVSLQVGMIFILGLLYQRKHFALYKNSRFVRDVVFMGLTRAGAGLLFVIALVMADNASLIGMMSGLKIIITAILAGIFLRETQFMGRKLAAAVVAFVGVGLMMW